MIAEAVREALELAESDGLAATLEVVVDHGRRLRDAPAALDTDAGS